MKTCLQRPPPLLKHARTHLHGMQNMTQLEEDRKDIERISIFTHLQYCSEGEKVTLYWKKKPVTSENKFPIYHRFYGMFDHSKEWNYFTRMIKIWKVGERDSTFCIILAAFSKNRTKNCKQAGITPASNPGGASSNYVPQTCYPDWDLSWLSSIPSSKCLTVYQINSQPILSTPIPNH